MNNEEVEECDDSNDESVHEDPCIGTEANDDATDVAVKNEDTELKKDTVGNKRKADKKISASLGYNRFMIEDAYKIGCHCLLKANLKITRLHAQAGVKRRQEVNKSVVGEMRNGNVKGSTELKEDSIIEMPPWTRLMTKKYPDFYH